MAHVMVERSAPVEVRLSGRTLHGIALRYGERARDRAEMFEPGAFRPIGPVALNLQHDSERVIASTEEGTLRLDDTADALRVEADLRDGSAELALVRRRALRGLSVEFRCLTERRENGLRIVSQAELPAIGLVDSGSYRTGIELRQRMAGAWLTASIPFASRLECTCQGGGCDSVEFDEGAFDEVLDDGRDVLAIGGQGFASVLGSRRRGTLLLDAGRRGLRVGLDGPTDTAAARQVIDNARAGSVYARPVIDVDASDFEDRETVRVFRSAAVRAILVKATPNDRGHRAATVRGVDPPESRRRRRVWL